MDDLNVLPTIRLSPEYSFSTETQVLSARTKLNAAYLLGSLAIAALVGGLLQSWTVFVLAAAMFVVLSLMNGTIRPRRRGR
jgi:hypothetical protein